MPVVALGLKKKDWVGDDCAGRRTEPGCAHRDSSLARFGERFWPSGQPAAVSTDAFVTPYASSAVHEDLAETFTAWVFDWPIARSGVAAEKIEFLESDEELSALRDELRSAAARLD